MTPALLRPQAETFRATGGDEPRSFAPAGLPQDAVCPPLNQDKVFYRWARRFSSTLVLQRDRFNGDMDQFLIHLMFMLAEMSWRTVQADALERGRPPRAPGARGLNALSVADITCIPRETTRRKLAALAASGYLRRGTDGLYYLSGAYSLDSLFQDLEPLFGGGVRPDPRPSPST